MIRTLWQSPRRLLLISAASIALLQTFLFVWGASIRGFATGDGGVKLWQVQAILRTGQLEAPINYPGAIYDPRHQYSPFVPPWFFWQDGRPYSEYTSPFIWASVPLYVAFGHAGLLLLPWLTSALLIILAGWLAWRARPDRSAALVPIIVGLGSPLVIYGMEFWEHTPGALLAVFALAGIVKAADSPRRSIWLMLAGAAVGLGLTMRAELYVYPIAIVIGSLLTRSIRERLPLIRTFFFLAAGGLMVAGPWWLYQFVSWGSPFGPRVAQNVPVLGGGEMLARLGNTTGQNYAMLWPNAGSGLDALAILGIIAMVLAIVLWPFQSLAAPHASRFTYHASRITFGLLALVLLAIVAITTWRIVNWNQVIGQRPDDLLSTFPVVLLLLLPVLSSRLQDQTSEIRDQRFDVTRFLFITSLAFVLLVLIASPFHGGIQWGPRFLLPIVVPMAVVVLAHFRRLWQVATSRARAGLAVVFGVLLLAGGYSTLTGIGFMHAGQIASADLSALIERAPERVVVTDAWFIPQAAPYTFDDKLWLMAEDEKPMLALIQQLRKTTGEPGMVYISALTWAHIDPQILLGPRIALEGELRYVDAPTQYYQIGRYVLLK